MSRNYANRQRVLVTGGAGFLSELVRMPRPADDPRQRQPGITLAKTRLDWAPQVPLEAGLERTIAYSRQLLAS